MAEHPQTLTYLDHAKERMAQRGVSSAEVEEAINNGEATTPEPLPGMLKIVGKTSASRRLSITRLQHFPVVVSVVETEDSR